MIYNIIIIILGLLASLVLFSRFPFIKKKDVKNLKYKISIIIPARNEEKNIGLLLEDLKHQNIKIEEIICVDDASTDKTVEIINSYSFVKIISIKDKPDDWVGKSFACYEGAMQAKGDILIFLDADVRLNQEAIASIISIYENEKSIISILPFHKTEKPYEQLSFFFNIIQVGANGLSTIFRSKHAGLYGPLILIPTETYKSIEGHNAVKNSIVEDVALGEVLKKNKYDFKLFMGKGLVDYRMYSGGVRDLFNGWTKNYATGALKTPIYIFIMVFLWITSCILTVASIIESVIEQSFLGLAIYFGAYVLWVFELFRISKRIGKFNFKTILFFPIYLLVFLLIFLRSLIRKIFKRHVVWKERNIKLE